jgi:hypothetical protein
LPPLPHFLLQQRKLDKTGSSHSYDISPHPTPPPPIIRNLEPIAIRKSGSLPVEREGCEDVWFKQRAITDFLTAEKIPPIDIRRRMHAVYGNK